MNRLWVRLSIAFSIVVLIAVMILVTSAFLVARPDTGDYPRLSENASELERQQFILQRVTEFLFSVAAVGGIVGIVAGIKMGRTLAAPLNELERAAQAIGSRDLSRRVSVKGSREMQAVAQAFNQMAADLQRAEALRRNLVADVAHELRTPLTVLQGNLRAILDDVYPLDKQEVARIYDQTRHLSRLVSDLHELAQAEARQLPLDLQDVDLNHLITSATAVFEPLAESEGVALHTRLPGNAAVIRADTARLTQALYNLLSNALRYTPEGGTVTLHVLCQEKQVQIKIHDTGTGIPQEQLKYIFDRFYRTDRARSRDAGGTGLGLAIVRATIEAHGGSISATSEGEGRGSTFTISLPRS